MNVPALAVLSSLAMYGNNPGISSGATTAPDPEQTTALLKALAEALASKNWPLVAALGVVLAVWLVRKFVAPRVPWLGTDRGGAVLVLLTALAGAVASALLGGAGLTLPVLVEALSVALTAAGGFNLFKKLVTTPAPAPVASPAPVPSPLDIVNGGQG